MVEIPSIVLKIAALLVVGIAAACDLKTQKIPNLLTFPASAVGIVMQSAYFASWSSGRDICLYAGAGALTGILGWIVGVLIMSLTKIFMRKFGHGDTKLVAAVGTFLGPGLVLMVYLYYSLCFGLYSMIKLGAAIPWRQLLMAAELKKAGIEAPLDLERFSQVRKQVIPVAPFIALGTLCCILFEKPTLELFGLK